MTKLDVDYNAWLKALGDAQEPRDNAGLTMDELCEKMGLSISTLREKLKVAKRKGLIKIRVGKRMTEGLDERPYLVTTYRIELTKAAKTKRR